MKSITLFLCSLFISLGTLTAADTNQLAILGEALSRLSADKVNAQPELKAALSRVLDSSKGTADFVELVQRFKVTERNPDLLELAIQKPNEQLGTDAVRALYSNNGLALIQSELAKTNTTRVINLIDVTGNAGGKNAETLLLPLITDTKRDVAIRRQALKGATKVQPGAQAILKLAKEDKLPADLRFVATSELNASRFPNIQKDAAEILPPPLSGSAQPLPPVSELLAKKGDVKKGEGVFFRVQSTCSTCHIVNGQGKDFGPALSEIGTKLGKDALYEAILEPSAGISFGYESWEIKLKNGDELYGLIVSETADSLSVKDASGLIRKIAKNDLKSRQTLNLSAMPAGLQMTMSTDDLVDLVEYLSSLRKK